MRVIFEKEFLESIRRIDNTLKITKYVIGTIYNSYTVGEEFMEKLFSGSYLYNDVRKTSEYPLNSIWDSNKKLLKINIDIPEEEKAALVEPSSEYCFIYCYGIYPDRSERIAFIITELEAAERKIIKFNRLDLNISSNLFELSFPKYTEANIETIADSDTVFLEGIGIDYGVNIFTSLKKKIVTKKSYYKYIRNKKTSGYSSSFLYNNISGEKIYNNSVIRQITSILSFSALEDTSSLKKSGGYINLLGTLECDMYRLINDYNISKIKEKVKIDITSLPVIEILVKESNGLEFKVDQVNKRLIYSANTTGKELNLVIVLKITNLDPITKKTSTIESGEIRLTQFAI